MSPRAPDTFPPDRGNGHVDHSQAPAAVYYVTAEGTRWRVHDCIVRGGKPIRIGLPGREGASCRVFVAKNNVKKLYRFARGELSWKATADQFDRQLAAAEFLATEAFQPAERTPR
jgi:hypothetical protein